MLFQSLLLFKYLDDLKSRNEISCEKYEKNGETYLKIKKYKVRFNPARLHLQFDNLFNGDKTLGIYQKSSYNSSNPYLLAHINQPLRRRNVLITVHVYTNFNFYEHHNPSRNLFHLSNVN